jgi:hypothetical protein
MSNFNSFGQVEGGQLKSERKGNSKHAQRSQTNMHQLEKIINQ